MTPEEKQQVIEETERGIAEWIEKKWPAAPFAHQVESGKWREGRERPPVTLTLPGGLAEELVSKLASVQGSIGVLQYLSELLSEAMKGEPEKPVGIDGACPECMHWLDRDKECPLGCTAESKTRWRISPSTSLSGAHIYFCLKCHRQSPTPDDKCPSGCELVAPKEPWFAIGDEVRLMPNGGAIGVVIVLDRVSGVRVQWICDPEDLSAVREWYAPEKLKMVSPAKKPGGEKC